MPIVSNLAQENMEPWLKEIVRSMAERAEAIRKEPYHVYQGQRVADFPPEMQKAFELAKITGDYEPFMRLAQLNMERGAESFANNADKYMNPYQKNVIDNLMHYSGRSFKEDILPALEGHFVGLGQHGSTRHQEMAERAARNQQESLNRAIGEQLSHGYETSGKFFNADAARALEAADLGPRLAAQQQAGKIGDIAILGNVGAIKQAQDQKAKDLAYQEFINQKNFPFEALKQQGAIMEGIPVDKALYQAQHTPGMAEPDAVANIGNIALGLAGALGNGRIIRDRKAGGGIKANIRKHSFAQSSFSKKPKVGGKYKMKKPFDIGRI